MLICCDVSQRFNAESAGASRAGICVAERKKAPGLETSLNETMALEQAVGGHSEGLLSQRRG